MGYGRKWQPSKAAKQEFAQKMKEIESFCREHNIQSSLSKDSYYFKRAGFYPCSFLLSTVSCSHYTGTRKGTSLDILSTLLGGRQCCL